LSSRDDAIVVVEASTDVASAHYDMRIAAVSDLHGYLPEIPTCDLLIVAGDICPDRFGRFSAKERPGLQATWFRETILPWLAAAPASQAILTWGNHDWCGQSAELASYLRIEAADRAAKIVVDSMVRVEAGGASITAWASPWSNQFMRWAFMKPPAQLAESYSRIPAGVDVLVSHQPPRGFGDRFVDVVTGKVEHLGSQELLAAIEQVGPRLVICGHIHSGHGRYIHAGVPIYNVSIVDEQYRQVFAPTVIDLEPSA
jgi:Icc-related predicted phosphoesterase